VDASNARQQAKSDGHQDVSPGAWIIPWFGDRARLLRVDLHRRRGRR
jgi:hypothetical protein